MSITEVGMALGEWSLTLNDNIPKTLLDSLDYFGHIVVVPGRVDPTQYNDNLLTKARYVGVYRGRESGESKTLRGCGMAFWLGDEDDKSHVFETPVNIAATTTFADSIRAVLPPAPYDSVHEGTLYAGVPASAAMTFGWTTPRKAIDYICQTASTATHPVEWRVNGNGTLDAGRVVDMFRTTPQAIIRRQTSGDEIGMANLPGQASLNADVEDYTTRVVLLAEGESGSIYTGSADAPVVPYKDLFGNTVRLVRMVSESETSAGNAAARAQLQLNRFNGTRNAVSLSTTKYDVKGSVNVGDYVYVFDPVNGFYDLANETYWQGVPINPIRLRCIEMTYPVAPGWTVCFRKQDGTYVDLTDYYVPETDATTIVVGEFSRNLSGIGSEPIGTRPSLDTSTPATPVFGTFYTAAYQSPVTGNTRANVQVTWATPNNADGSTVTDGDHYEIRYRRQGTYAFKPTWNSLHGYTWNDLHTATWDRLLPGSNPAADAADWQVAFVAWGQESFLIQELLPLALYEFQIRAVDGASPPNMSAWSASTTFTTANDVVAPSTPAPPTVSAGRVSIQVMHMLGLASGGTFNLDADLHHLEVHVGGSESFYPDAASLVGKLMANSGNIIGRIAVVSTFQIEPVDQVYVKVVAVDYAGNKSSPSTAVAGTPDLIDNAHISDLSVSKVTAGTITADWVTAARIKTADSGARAEMNMTGFHAFNANGIETFTADNTGNVSLLGTVRSGNPSGQHIEISTSGNQPLLQFYQDDGVSFSFIQESDIVDYLSAIEAGLLVSSGPWTSSDLATQLQARLYVGAGMAMSGQIGLSNPALQSPVGGRWNIFETGANMQCYDAAFNRITEAAFSTTSINLHLDDTGGTTLTDLVMDSTSAKLTTRKAGGGNQGFFETTATNTRMLFYDGSSVQRGDITLNTGGVSFAYRNTSGQIVGAMSCDGSNTMIKQLDGASQNTDAQVYCTTTGNAYIDAQDGSAHSIARAGAERVGPLAFLEVKNTSGTILGAVQVDNDTLHIKGKFLNYQDDGATNAIFAGRVATSNTAGIHFSYGTTATSVRTPIVTLEVGTLTGITISTEAVSTTGFDCNLSTTIGGTHVYNFWCFRV